MTLIAIKPLGCWPHLPPPSQLSALGEWNHRRAQAREGGMKVALLPMPAQEGKSWLGPCQRGLLLASTAGVRCLTLRAGRQTLSMTPGFPASRWLQKLLYFPHTLLLECPPRHSSRSLPASCPVPGWAMLQLCHGQCWSCSEQRAGTLCWRPPTHTTHPERRDHVAMGHPNLTLPKPSPTQARLASSAASLAQSLSCSIT